MILTIRFADKHLTEFAETIKQRIYELGVELFQVGIFSKSSKLENFIRLESVNVLLALSEMGQHYLLPPDVVGRIFLNTERFSYFDVISCLFYIRNYSQYADLKKLVVEQIEAHFSDLSEIEVQSELACLFLDVVSCPYIEEGRKAKWVQRYAAKFGPPTTPSNSEIHQFVGAAGTRPWFVNWNEIDLLNALERKELKRAY